MDLIDTVCWVCELAEEPKGEEGEEGVRNGRRSCQTDVFRTNRISRVTADRGTNITMPLLANTQAQPVTSRTAVAYTLIALISSVKRAVVSEDEAGGDDDAATGEDIFVETE